MSSTDLLPIGEVAKTSGISVSAVRYYEEIGVISSATRVGGKRRFDPATIGRVSFIRRAQEAGFSLEEIGTILDDETGIWRVLVDDKLIELTERKDRLETMISMLAEIRECGCGAVAACPLVTTS
ncbi:MAG: MerR family transcriptional regulator [Acidobacteria bacterium]|nr:MerR family transcriptional regulator [Acidobacteriota bacterium]MCH8990944.1 MerR family transcriptional regulator [Acidobacteriota bacterium]